VALGLAFIAMGVLLVLISVGVVPGAEKSLEAPRWVGACAGLMFAFCGGAIIVGYAVAGGAGPDGDLPAGTPRWVRLTQFLLGLGIISALAVNERLTFNNLKSLLQTTDGNLSVHARKLEDAEYIACDKTFEGRVPRTEYRLTAAGRRAFEKYLAHMEAIIKAVRD
jgi:DNA-binding transcriptional ArsR family regulator